MWKSHDGGSPRSLMCFVYMVPYDSNGPIGPGSLAGRQDGHDGRGERGGWGVRGLWGVRGGAAQA